MKDEALIARITSPIWERSWVEWSEHTFEGLVRVLQKNLSGTTFVTLSFLGGVEPDFWMIQQVLRAIGKENWGRVDLAFASMNTLWKVKLAKGMM